MLSVSPCRVSARSLKSFRVPVNAKRSASMSALLLSCQTHIAESAADARPSVHALTATRRSGRSGHSLGAFHNNPVAFFDTVARRRALAEFFDPAQNLMAED
jgi:hypothetical protein